MIQQIACAQPQPSIPALTPAVECLPMTASAGTVLVVEDEGLILFMAAEALQDEGYRVIVAADAHEAEALLTAEPVDVLFTDIDLARGTNGLLLARRARHLRPDLGVVYASGGRRHLDAREAVAGSFFLPKPYRLEEACALVRRAAGAGLPAEAAR